VANVTTTEMNKRNVKITKSNGIMWKCEVTDSYGITHVNYWETQEQASKWTYYIWENEDSVVDKDELETKAILECIEMDKEIGLKSNLD